MSLNPKNKAACHVCTKAALARLRSGSDRGAGDWNRNDRTARNDHLTPIGSNALSRGTSRAHQRGVLHHVVVNRWSGVQISHPTPMVRSKLSVVHKMLADRPSVHVPAAGP